jgi:hypothetical protein
MHRYLRPLFIHPSAFRDYAYLPQPYLTGIDYASVTSMHSLSFLAMFHSSWSAVPSEQYFHFTTADRLLFYK